VGGWTPTRDANTVTNMKVWEVEVELNMNASNTIKLEIVASI